MVFAVHYVWGIDVERVDKHPYYTLVNSEQQQNNNSSSNNNTLTKACQSMRDSIGVICYLFGNVVYGVLCMLVYVIKYGSVKLRDACAG